MKFRNAYNFKLTESDLEKIEGESQTIQGEAYSILDLLIKHSSGTLPDIETKEVYYDNQDFDSIDMEKAKNLDLTEKEEIIKSLNIDENAKNLYEKEKKQKKQKLKNQIIKEIEEEKIKEEGVKKE